MFRPARFLGDWPRDAFIPFSGGMFGCNLSLTTHDSDRMSFVGPRGCIGRKYVWSFHIHVGFPLKWFLECRFAETESVAMLTILSMRYKIHVKEEPEFADETFEQKKARVLASTQGITQR